MLSHSSKGLSILPVLLLGLHVGIAYRHSYLLGWKNTQDVMAGALPLSDGKIVTALDERTPGLNNEAELFGVVPCQNFLQVHVSP